MTTIGNLAVTDTGGYVGGVELSLTAFELKLLRRLVEANGEVVPVADLHEALYGTPGIARDSNVLQVFVGRLRLKLSRACAHVAIATARGKGYALGAVAPIDEATTA
ncbi:helix-turn-helix domain-containing protein [Luteimonas saliphila]|uniref:helix-turn-helix domain-containing protein n=1 Tax=Luteimonas saliphila TaxID=2804919 RepID=UPI00192D2910|nr:helix-turn-helix domain-containing protein [Luteimonas saliphila]